MKTTKERLRSVVGKIAAAGLILGATSAAQAQTVAWWKMDAWATGLYVGGNPATHGIVDSANGAGQGTIAGNSGDPNVAHDPLYVWGPMEGLAGGLIGPAAPAAMLNSITSSGSFNYNAAINLGGTSFYAADQFGNEFNGSSWTAELFFKTTGSGSGIQTLLWAKEGHAGSHLQLNTPPAGAGGLEFWGYDGTGLVGLSLTTADYAPGYTDGQWHYVAARYDDASNLMSLWVANENGSVNYKQQVMANDLILNGGNNNIIVGRQEGEGNRFGGLIDEVRLSNGSLLNSDLIGVVPEPSSFALIGLGSLVLLAFRNRRKA
jgi:hypothetical protein